MSTPSGANSKMPGVHAFRGYASLLVVSCHAADAVKRFSGDGRLDWMIEGGIVGVAFFFVLSGFIMGHVHGRDRRDLGQAKRFLLKRIIRVVPTYWIVTLAIFVALQFSSDFGEKAHHHLSALFNSLMFIPTAAGPIVRVGWTLHHEVLFYAIFGIALYVLRRPALVMGLWSGVILYTGVANHFHRSTEEAANQGLHGLWTLLSSPLNLLFPIGLLTVVMSQTAAARQATRSKVSWGSWLTMIIALGFLGFAWFWVVQAGNDLSTIERWWKPVVYGVLSMALLGVVALPSVGRHFGGVLNTFLGDASYAIYLVHYYLIAVVCRATQSVGLAKQPFLLWLLLVLSSLVGGGLFHYLVEKPITRRLARLALEPSKRPAAAT